MNQIATERWLPVVGYEGAYEVSDQGRVRSLDRLQRISRSRDGRMPHLRDLEGRVRQQSLNSNGYCQVNLSLDGRRHIARVHVLVLEAFTGPRPDGMEGCHGNGERTDNRLVNLRWDTRESNFLDRARAGKAKRTHCDRGGHEYTPENTRIYGVVNPKKICLTCKREKARDRYQKTSAQEAWA